MPEGPAIGRVEAKRRALTTPSTAPPSRARWCDRKIWIQERNVASGKTRNAPEPISARFVGTIVPANLDTKTCTRAARSSCTTCARRH